MKIFLLLILFLSALISDTTFQKAKDALDQKDVVLAIKLFKKSYRNGNNEASYELGKIYSTGKFIKQDFLKAIDYFKVAADYGNNKAKYNIAVIYGLKKYSQHNYEKSYKLFLELAQQGYGKAQNRVGMHLRHGVGVEKDFKLSFRWFENAYFKHNYIPAVCNLAVMFANGYGVFPNFGRAAKLAKVGLKKNLPTCKRVFKEFNLHKYKKDKGFKTDYYR